MLLTVRLEALITMMQAFEKEASAHGLEMQALPQAEGEAARAALRDVVGDGEYFHVYLPDGTQVLRSPPEWQLRIECMPVPDAALRCSTRSGHLIGVSQSLVAPIDGFWINDLLLRLLV